MRRLGWVLCAVWIGCGGSEFVSSDEPDASAGTGGTGGETTGGTGGEATGGTGGGATGGTGGGATGGTGASSGSSGAAGSSGTAGTAGAAGTANPCEGTCAPSVAGWDGPFVVREGDGLPPLACPTELDSFHGELQVPSFCPCACASDTSPDRSAVVRFHNANDCGSPPCNTLVVPVADCVQIPVHLCTVPPVAFEVGTHGFCRVDGPTEPPDPTWGIDGQSCLAVSEPGTCDGPQTCYASLEATDRLCIRHSDQVNCPAPYDERRIRYHDYDDERKCSPCVCEPEASVGTLSGFTVAGCTQMTNHFSTVPKVCSPMPAAVSTHLKYTNLTGATVDCAPGEMPMMSGTAKPTGEVTFCCLP